jgi:hypothetical protein
METNPDIPNEILVTELDHLCFNNGFVEGEIYGTYVRLCISIHALQSLFEYACQEGILVVNNDVYYKRAGQIRRYKRAKDKKR